MKTETNLKKIDLSLFCSSTHCNKVYEYVYIKNGFAYASDTIVAIKYDLTDMDGIAQLNETLIHSDEYIRMMQADSIRIYNGEILALSKTEQKIYTERNGDRNTYPKIESIFKTNNEVVDGVKRIGIDPKHLKLIGEFLNESYISIFQFNGDNRAIRITTRENEKIEILLMPMYVDKY